MCNKSQTLCNSVWLLIWYFIVWRSRMSLILMCLLFNCSRHLTTGNYRFKSSTVIRRLTDSLQLFIGPTVYNCIWITTNASASVWNVEKVVKTCRLIDILWHRIKNNKRQKPFSWCVNICVRVLSLLKSMLKSSMRKWTRPEQMH